MRQPPRKADIVGGGFAPRTSFTQLMEAKMVNQSPVMTVANAMDEMKFSAFHGRVMALIIGGLFFDLFDVAVLGSLAPDLIRTQFAAPGQIAVVASATFLGLLIGSVGQGELTDRFGRKVVYQANLLIYGFATIAAAASPNYLVLAILRFVAGLGLGARAVQRSIVSP
jgi:putative MFS transporter